MPDPKTNPLYIRWRNALDKGMMVENKGKYTGKNPRTKATGKYQFLPSWLPNIQKFAKLHGFNDVKTMDDFEANPKLQDAFYDEYVETQMWPFVLKHNKEAKKRGLTWDELGYMYHHHGPGKWDTKTQKGTGTMRFLKTGKWREADSYGNKNGKETIADYQLKRAENGGIAFTGDHTTGDDTPIAARPVSPAAKQKAEETAAKAAAEPPKKSDRKQYEAFQKEMADLAENKNELTPEQMVAQAEVIQRKYQDKGLIPAFNKIIEEDNAKGAKEFAENKAKAERLMNVANKLEFTYDQQGNDQELSMEAYAVAGNGFWRAIGAEFSNDEMIALKKEFPGLFVLDSRNKGGRSEYKVNIKELNNRFENLTAKTGNKTSLFDIRKTESKEKPGYNEVRYYKKNETPINVSNQLNTLPDRIAGKGTSHGTVDFTKVFDGAVEYKKASPLALYPENAPKKDEEYGDGTDGTETGTGTKTETTKPAADPNKYKPTPTKTTPKKEEVFDYFASEMPEGELMASPEQFKDNFPWGDVLAEAGGVLIGLGLMDKDIPMRDEQVNDAYRNYAAELAMISKQGLRPEEEAYAKRMLTESYQGSIDNLVESSNGNRNLVLGNLGRLDAQYQQGLIQLGVADAAAKTEAMYKYGEAMKYINEFDAARDIANTEIKQLDAIKTKEMGANLAAFSFAQVLDSMAWYRENGPGTANYNFRSHMNRRLLGYDPNLKDDGTGTQPGTYSHYKATFEKGQRHRMQYNQTRAIVQRMSKEDRDKANQFAALNQNPDDYSAFVAWLEKNPNMGGTFNATQMAQATKSGDYGLLFTGAKPQQTASLEHPLQLAQPTFGQKTVTGTPAPATAPATTATAVVPAAQQVLATAANAVTPVPAPAPATATIPQNLRKFFDADGNYVVDMSHTSEGLVNRMNETKGSSSTVALTPAQLANDTPVTQAPFGQLKAEEFFAKNSTFTPGPSTSGIRAKSMDELWDEVYKNSY